MVTSKDLERLWETRPVRSDRESTIGGVCAGIARRYRVDPTLIRVAFAVAALFGGSGAVLYLVCWIAFPSQPDLSGPDLSGAEWDGSNENMGGPHGPRDPLQQWRSDRRDRRARRDARRRGRGRRDHHRGGRPPALVVIAAVVVISIVFTPHFAWGTGFFVGVALMLLGWWLLYQRTPQPVPGTGADTIGIPTDPSVSPAPAGPEFDPATPGSAPASMTSTVPATSTLSTTSDEARVLRDRQPPSWDPLGAAPFAWDLPAPEPLVSAPKESGRHTVTVVSMGLALVVAAVLTATALLGVEALTPLRICSAALTVLGGGLLIGSIVGKSRGLMPIAVLLSVAVVIIALVDHLGPMPSGGVGDRTWSPTSMDQLSQSYELTAGSARLDLGRLDLTTDAHIDVRVGLGDVIVTVPRDVAVTTRCATPVGDVSCIPSDSPSAHRPRLTIDAHTNAGRVEIRRA
ncbi:hypothetical protein GCM10027169_04820 [Gordonia jinhuaensis]|uniref:Phage shock protein PspC N-terminal domain-containing protein n=1 Tax=Gordonia jinhuaensis TaxID=1517702 RepID=A0A916WPG8_9ACTN|nr:PspC domain-containing protein [Gordonia jinhuaensis]GGB17336.1 hypothetical protein GCM10011489_01780 [Gordonia jinhuaensis]